MAASPPEPCRHANCPRSRTPLSVFCAEHHAAQLGRAGSGVDLPPRDAWRLVVGPLWLNVVRGGLSGLSAVSFDRPAAVVAIVVVALASAVIGWRWSRRLIWRPDLGFPVAFLPSPRFLVPLAAYALATAGVAGGAAAWAVAAAK